ncbi:N-acetyltransferase family protein [Pelagerythrobacter sp.]|uniref:GNAT family N-acetyltransferase n=1 Tax=Pelagerythrobacter sp. TaxID=2800702 RepID=UPI0035B03885
MDDCAIRRANPDDAERLALVGAATFLETFAGAVAGAALLAHCRIQHAAETYRAYFDRGASAWLAECGGAPVGYALLAPPELEAAREGDIELKRIYVLSRFHGSGLAGALFDALVPAARAHRRMLVGVKDDNDRAIAFYVKNGFRQIGTRRFDVGGTLYDDAVLARPLSPMEPADPAGAA